MIVIRYIPRNILHTRPTEWYLVDLPALRSTWLGRAAWLSSRGSVREQLFHAYPVDHPLAHTLVAAEDDLAAHLADREVKQSVVARLAGQAGAAAHHSRRVGRVGRVTSLRAPAKGTEECLWSGRRRGVS
ncbi:hypothetical protein KVR01_008428 [Diaporthe batatas]|uniref:uncharacterized protein n=1 Tax=Diaporthe batatas TaxID=748121 RepID=UPI001D04EEE5|nr:uncharacterized protein KVR01_008428 [Diaporthe batatas]KAG8161441.1 hypothetical protein KVR01_008428 [Diaporthe batatas]